MRKSVFKKTFTFRLIACWIIFSFIVSAVTPANAQIFANGLNLPAPGTMITITPAFMPVMMKGMQVHPDNPLLFDFIIDTGKSGLKVNSPAFKTESQKLIKYFLLPSPSKKKTYGSIYRLMKKIV
ncbi:MAG: hypothetical protein HQL26_07465 [Candidatus Omnitrophica bacterium]|nr:hypothetical protein [Candidatus Omnitrophota bacterium]